MNKLSAFTILFLFTAATATGHADQQCWKALGVTESAVEKFTPAAHVEGAQFEHLAVLHSDSGTIRVSKNGNCERIDKRSYSEYMSERLEKLADVHLEFKLKADGYIRQRSGPFMEKMSREEYQKSRAQLMDILKECSSEKGKVGEVSRAILMKFGNNLESQIQTGSSKAF